MTMEDKILAEKLETAGNELLSILISEPSSLELLLFLLDKLEKFLLQVRQSPSNSLQEALIPATKALATKQLLNHTNVEVKVYVASCIVEIMRITAPNAPYDDEQMKEMFKLIIAAFDNLSDISSPSYKRIVSILETFARIRLWVLMLDLECNSLILQMFEFFLRNLRENHPDSIFMYMGFIMIYVLEEVEDISPKLLSLILNCVRKGNQSVLPITQKLCERVMENCVSKLVPYMNRAVQYMGSPLDDYGNIVSYICKQNPGTNDRSNLHALQDSTAMKHMKMVQSADSDKKSSVSEHHISMESPTKKSKKGNPEKEKENFANLPNPDAACEMHENNKPKISSNALSEETMYDHSWKQQSGGISTTESDVKISGSNHLKCVENFTKSENYKASSEAGNREIVISNIFEDYSVPNEHAIDDTRKLKDALRPTVLRNDDSTRKSTKGEDENERNSMLLIGSYQMTKGKSGTENHQILLEHQVQFWSNC